MKRVLQAIALLLGLCVLLLLLPSLWLPAVVSQWAAHEGVGAIELDGVAWDLEGISVRAVEASLSASEPIQRVEARNLRLQFEAPENAKPRLHLESLRLTVVASTNAEAPADAQASAINNNWAVPEFSLRIDVLEVLADQALTDGRPEAVQLQDLRVELEALQARFGFALAAPSTDPSRPKHSPDSAHTLQLDGQLSLRQTLSLDSLSLTVQQPGVEPLLRVALAPLTETVYRLDTSLVLNPAQDWAGLAAAFAPTAPQYSEMLAVLAQTELEWQAKGEVNLPNASQPNGSIDLTHAFTLRTAHSDLGQIALRGAMMTAGSAADMQIEISQALQGRAVIAAADGVEQIVSWDIEPGATFTIEGAQLGLGALTGRLQIEEPQARVTFTLPQGTLDMADLNGSLEARLELRAPLLGREPVGLQAQTKFSWVDGYALDGRFTSTTPYLTGEYQVKLDANGRGQWSTQLQSDALPELLQRAQKLTSDLDDLEVISGRMLVRYEADLDASDLTQAIQVDLLDVAGDYDDYPFEGMNVQALLNPTQGWYSERDIAVYVGQVDAIFPIFDVTLGAALLPDDPSREKTLRVNLLRLSTLEGAARAAEPFDLAMESWHADMNMQLEGLRLAQMLQIYGEDVLDAGGEIIGLLPVSIRDDDIYIDGGWAKNNELGGYIRYRLQQAGSLGAGNEQANLAFQLLEDFIYSNLSADLTMTPEGELTINLSLDGHNPNVLDGQRVVFNVNLEQNILEMIEAWRATEKYLEAAGQRVKVKQMESADDSSKASTSQGAQSSTAPVVEESLTKEPLTEEP